MRGTLLFINLKLIKVNNSSRQTEFLKLGLSVVFELYVSRSYDKKTRGPHALTIFCNA